MNSRLLGVYDFTADPAVYGQHLARWLAQARQGDLLMCHPGLPAPAGAAADAIAMARQAEWTVLSAAQTFSAGPRLRPMSALLR
jgi:hypothetical protein